MAKELLVLDVDTGIDDALALILAARSPEAEVLAVGTVAGNIGAEQAGRNTLTVLDALGATIPVAVGLDRGLLRPSSVAPSVHGHDGLGDAGLPASSQALSGEHAVDQLIRLAHERPGQITLVATGPLSNVAAALIREPALAQLLKRVVVMGGAVGVPGNVTAVAEANIWHDPEAAQLVLTAGWPLTLVALDVTMTTFLRRAELDRLRASERPVARLVSAISPVYSAFYQRMTGQEGYALHDPLAVAIALDPGLVAAAVDLDVQVETHSELTLGMTVADRRTLLGPGYPQPQRPVSIPLAVDGARFLDRLMDALLA